MKLTIKDVWYIIVDTSTMLMKVIIPIFAMYAAMTCMEIKGVESSQWTWSVYVIAWFIYVLGLTIFRKRVYSDEK